MSRRISCCAMMVALAMVFSYVEVLIPFNFGIPGMKLGIANLVIVVGLYLLKLHEVLIISVARIMLMGLLFGNGMSIVYSLAGGILSLAVMAIARKVRGLSITGVSIAGGVSHNVGQLLVAAAVVENMKLFYYLPALLIAGMITGAMIGIVSGKIFRMVCGSQKWSEHTSVRT